MSEGVLVLNKPVGPTSFDVVARVRRALKTREVGHAGTLDPKASGVLVVLVGKYCKLQEHMMLGDKRYRAEVLLGVSTTTDDTEGEVVATAPVPAFTSVEVQAALQGLVGKVQQVPPIYSAIHQDGERLYARARRGEDVQAAARTVDIYALDLVELARDDTRAAAVVDVHCGKGTYVRSIARDLGARLGVPAHLRALTRTASAGFVLADALDAGILDDPGAARAALRTGLRAIPSLPLLEVNSAVAQRLRHGQRVAPEDVAPAALPAVPSVAHHGDELVAVVVADGGVLRTRRGL